MRSNNRLAKRIAAENGIKLEKWDSGYMPKAPHLLEQSREVKSILASVNMTPKEMAQRTGTVETTIVKYALGQMGCSKIILNHMRLVAAYVAMARNIPLPSGNVLRDGGVLSRELEEIANSIKVIAGKIARLG